MQIHQTIFSVKEVRAKIKTAFVGIPQYTQKLRIIENWQKNIVSGKYIKAKEEEIKPIFLTQFFGEILGYSYQDPAKWQMALETKTATDSTKADATLGFFEITDNQEIKKDIRVALEIKNARTTLDKPQNRRDFKGSSVEQAFSYASKIGESCKWVIVSNFLEIRLYLASDMSKYEHFDIMSLHDEQEFSRFYYLLAKGQLFLENADSVIDVMLANRIEKEKNITNTFYREYRFLRELFFYHLKAHNAHLPPLALLGFAQVIIDRVVFISVVKDYDLLPFQVLRDVEEIATKSWEKDKQELWRQLKKLFVALDEGFPLRVHQLNGGLFRPNPILDALTVKDIMLKRLLTLNNYDFESDLNINILGHIFEQSISDIELLKQEISEGKEATYLETDEQVDLPHFDSEENLGKRKKDGIFYTPENITREMIQATIGTWLDEKKQALGISNFTNFPENEQEKEHQIALWEEYKVILRSIKVLDPACGSGAFLTQAFDYLLQEWQTTLDFFQKLKGEKIEIRGDGLFSKANNPLQNELSEAKRIITTQNLFGVDLNFESIEITKLGLWLKSASKNDALVMLDDNIKCGNSLISDPLVAENAFVWEKEFPEIMQNGGFDIVVGNPPYVTKLTSNQIPYFQTHYKTIQGKKYDLFRFFIERGLNLVKKNGLLSFITPDVFLNLKQASLLRAFILSDFSLKSVSYAPVDTFDAQVEPVIFIIRNESPETSSTKLIDFETGQVIKTVAQKLWLRDDYNIDFGVGEAGNDIIIKLKQTKQVIKDAMIWKKGLGVYSVQHLSNKFSKEEVERIMQERPWTKNYQADETFGKELIGADIKRYHVNWNGKTWLSYGNWLAFQRPIEFFYGQRILVREITTQGKYNVLASFVEEKYYNNQSIFNGIMKENTSYHVKFILALINSRLFSFYITNTAPKNKRKLFPTILMETIELFPLVYASKEIQNQIIDLVNRQLELASSLDKNLAKFASRIATNFKIKKQSESLSTFYKMDSERFFKTLEKQKVKLTLKKQDEIEEYFNENKILVLDIIEKMKNNDTDIDNLVYQLYGLTDPEKTIVENS